MEVGVPADLEAVIEVLSRDGAAIAPATKVELEQWGGGPPLQARVRLVEPAAFTKVSALGVEEQRVNVVADILTPPPQRPSLGDNFRVEARIIMWGNVGTVVFRDGKTLVSGGNDGRLCVWDSESRKDEFTFASLPNPIQDLDFTPDSQCVVAIQDGRVRLWHTSTLQAMTHPDGLGTNNLSLSLTSRHERPCLAMGAQGGQLTIWDVIGNDVGTSVGKQSVQAIGNRL